MEPIGTEVRRELARFGPAGGMAEIVEAWPAVVGEAIARNAWPARVARDGTLHVATSSSAWAFELAQLEGELAGRLREALGSAAPPRLRFAIGPVPEPPPPVEAPSGAVREPSPHEVETGRRIAAAISDDELREAVAAAAARSLAHGSADRGF